MLKRVAVLAVAVLLQGAVLAHAAPADPRAARPASRRIPQAPVTLWVLQVHYLALVTPVGTTAPASMVEYEVRVEQEAGFATAAAAEARALEIGRDGVVLGPEYDRRAIPPHRVQQVNVLSLAVRQDAQSDSAR